MKTSDEERKNSWIVGLPSIKRTRQSGRRTGWGKRRRG